MDVIVENWSLIGDSYYIKYHFYNMAWSIDNDNFKNYYFAHETYGGSIAVISKNPTNQKLLVFSPSGRYLSSIVWKDATVIGLYWSDDENIFLLQKSGRIAIHDLHCEYVKYVQMGDTVKQHGVKSFKFFASLQGTGLMVLTEYNELFYKTNLMNTDSVIKPIKNSKQSITDNITDWVAFTDLNDKEVVAIFASKNILIKLKNDKEPEMYSSSNKWFNANSRIYKLSLTMSEQRLAMVMTDGKIWILKSDLSVTIASCQFDFIICDDDPVQLEWAGEDCLVFYHQDYLYLMDTNGQSCSVFYIDDPLMFPEIDGVRLITFSKHEFIQKIPHQLEQLYQFSSNSPAMLLFDAQQHLDNKMSESVNFIELILSKEGHMQEAINVCLGAASYCLEPKWQKTILKAVRFGRSYFPEYKSEKVEDVHKKLLLLNNLKLPCIAMPVTMYQLEKMSMDVLIDRLINRNYYPFVELICTQLRIPKNEGINRMLEHWAEKYIKRSEEEYLLANKIIKRLENHLDFDFAKIASKSCDLEKYVLAEKLLEKEGRIHCQVKIFIKLKKYNLALTRSIESGDNDLISWVVSELQSKLSFQDFILSIHKYPIAKAMYIENLIDLSNQESEKSKRYLDDLDDSITIRIENQFKKILRSDNIQSALSSVNAVQDLYKKANNEFMIQIMDEEKVLLQNMSTTMKNAELDMTPGGIMMPIHDYLSFLFQNKLYEKADNFKQKLKISDRQFYWLKLNTCAKNNDWDEFNATVLKWNRKTPDNYYDIGEICAEYDNEVYLKKIIDKVEPEKQVRLYVKMNKLQEAEDLAKLIKNDYLIHYVLGWKY